jgi:nitrate reductase NapD
MNTTSVVVKTRPEHLKEVIKNLKSVDLCEVHFQDELGKIVVTVECDRRDSVMQKIKQIRDLPYVLSTDLVFSYSGEE